MPQYKVSFVFDSPFDSVLNVRWEILRALEKQIDGSYAKNVQVEKIDPEAWAFVSEDEFLSADEDYRDDLFLMKWDSPEDHDNPSGICITRDGKATYQYGDCSFGASEKDREWAESNFQYADLFNDNGDPVAFYRNIKNKEQ